MKLIVRIKSEKLKGGKGDYRPDSDFNPIELAKGIKHELEHTKDKKLAMEIAKDHLIEDPYYYTHLKSAGIKEYLNLLEQSEKSSVLLGKVFEQIEKYKDKIWVFFDTETTGQHPEDPDNRQITEIAAIAVRPSFNNGDAQILSKYHKKIKLTNETLKSIELEKKQSVKNDKFAKRQMSIEEILKMTKYFDPPPPTIDERGAMEEFVSFIKNVEKEGKVLLIAHNAEFDRRFVSVRSAKYGIEKLNNKTIDTLKFVYDFFYPLMLVTKNENILNKLKTKIGAASFTMGTLSAAFGIDNSNWHTAIADVAGLINITQQMISHIIANKELNIRKGAEVSTALRRQRASWK